MRLFFLLIIISAAQRRNASRSFEHADASNSVLRIHVFAGKTFSFSPSMAHMTPDRINNGMWLHCFTQGLTYRTVSVGWWAKNERSQTCRIDFAWSPCREKKPTVPTTELCLGKFEQR
jgi:hypothetical protein